MVESQRLEPTERNVTVPSVTISDSSLFPVSRSSNLLPWFEGEYPPEKSGHRVVQTRKSPIPPMPPRITKESHRPRVSDRTMSYRLSERITVTLVLVSRNAWRRHHSKMEPQLGGTVSPFRVTKPSNDFLRKTTRRSRVPVQTMGLNAETKKCRHRADGKFCLLRFPFESICPAVLNQNHTGRGFARINAYERTQAVETPASRLPAGVASTRRDRPEKWTVML